MYADNAKVSSQYLYQTAPPNNAVGVEPPPPLLQRIVALLVELSDYQVEADSNLHDLSGCVFGFVPEAGAQAKTDMTQCSMSEELIERLRGSIARARNIHNRVLDLKSALI